MKIYVDKNEVSIEYEKDEKINRGEYKAHKCDFNFSKEYDGLTKKAIFETSMEKKEMPIINNECDIPYEVLNSERINLRVYAYSTENDELILRYSPKYSEFCTLDGSYIDGAEPSEEITPTQFEQYTDALNKGLDKVDDTLEELNELSKSVEASEKDRDKKVDDAVSNIQDMTESYKQNANNKIQEFNDNYKDKTNVFNKNAENKENELNDYTSTKKTELNNYSEDLINSFNTNATNKTDDFNNNSKTKIAEFSQNAVSKTDTFNSNANAKTQAFNENVETQINEFEEVVNSTLSSFESETSQYVKNTDYANADKSGVIRTGYCFGVASNGIPICGAVSYSTYQNALDGIFIAKGTLENVLLGKNLISGTNYPTSEKSGVIRNGNQFTNSNGIPFVNTMTYNSYKNSTNGAFIGKGTLENVLNAKIGSIDTILDTINGEVI